MSAYIWLAWFAELGLTVVNKSSRYLSDLYLITFAENSWVISNSGQFIDAKFFKTDANSNDYWVYANNELIHQNNLEGRVKRMPYLSCIFTTKENLRVSLDDFLEDTRCNDGPGLTLPVLMAAFAINQKMLHNWYSASFEAINRDGDKVTFTGDKVSLVLE
jgi:hypothetical protein